MAKRRRRKKSRSQKTAGAAETQGRLVDAPAEDTPPAAEAVPATPEEDVTPAETDGAAAGEGADAALDEDVAVTTAAWQELQTKANEYLELAQRTRADLENYRRRVAREMEQLRVRSQGDLLRELLNPLDDLDRALQHAAQEEDFDTLFEGLKMVREAVWKAVGASGCERIPAAPGDTFDPNVHEAMVQIPHPEFSQGSIVEEVQPGYRLDELVLRAAKVVVSAGPPA